VLRLKLISGPLARWSPKRVRRPHPSSLAHKIPRFRVRIQQKAIPITGPVVVADYSDYFYTMSDSYGQGSLRYFFFHGNHGDAPLPHHMTIEANVVVLTGQAEV
jgi:hypothetical protein